MEKLLFILVMISFLPAKAGNTFSNLIGHPRLYEEPTRPRAGLARPFSPHYERPYEEDRPQFATSFPLPTYEEHEGPTFITLEQGFNDLKEGFGRYITSFLDKIKGYLSTKDGQFQPNHRITSIQINSYINSDILSFIAIYFPSLKKLHINSSQIMLIDHDLKNIGLLKSLKELVITGKHDKLTDQFFSYLLPLKLESLVIVGDQNTFTDLGLIYLAGISSFVRSREVLGTHDTLRRFPPTLKTLTLYGNKIKVSNAGLSIVFKRLTRLEFLGIEGKRNIFDYSGLSEISTLQNLKKLRLWSPYTFPMKYNDFAIECYNVKLEDCQPAILQLALDRIKKLSIDLLARIQTGEEQATRQEPLASSIKVNLTDFIVLLAFYQATRRELSTSSVEKDILSLIAFFQRSFQGLLLLPHLEQVDFNDPNDLNIIKQLPYLSEPNLRLEDQSLTWTKEQE
jgi:hypothetical protein